MDGNIVKLFGGSFNASMVDPNQPEKKSIDNPEQGFIDQLVAFGMQFNGELIEGEFSHLPIDNPKKKHGWYFYFGRDGMSNIASGIYGDWRSGDQFHWMSVSENQLSAEEYKSYQQRIAEIKKRYEDEKQKKQDETARQAIKLINGAEAATAENSYLQRKRVKPHEIYQVGDVLHIPMQNSQGQVRNVQRIYRDGFKAFLEGGQVLGCFHVIGGGEISGVVEGYATGATIHEITGKTIAIAFNTANLRHVVDAIREKHKQPITIYADNDLATFEKEGRNPGIEAAEKAAKDQYQVSIVVPQITKDQGSDFNDLAAVNVDQARTQLIGNKPKRLITLDRAGTLGDIKPTEWIIRNHLPSDCFGSMYGPSGHGKTFNIIDMAMSVATGQKWHGREVEQGAVVYVCGEGKNGILKRLSAWCKHYNIPLDDVPFYISSRPVMMLDPDMLADFQEQTVNLVNELGNVSLVIIDTLNRNFGDGDENRTEDMTRFVGACDDIKRSVGASVMVVHHTGLQDATRARGSSALRAALDVEMAVEKIGDDSSRLTCTKMKDDEPFLPIMFKMSQVSVGMVKTQYGIEEVKSVVLEAEKDPEQNAELARGLLAGRSKNVEIGIEIVQELADTVRRNRPEITEILIGVKDFSEMFSKKVNRRASLSETKAKLIELGVVIPMENNHHNWVLGKI